MYKPIEVGWEITTGLQAIGLPYHIFNRTYIHLFHILNHVVHGVHPRCLLYLSVAAATAQQLISCQSSTSMTSGLIQGGCVLKVWSCT